MPRLCGGGTLLLNTVAVSSHFVLFQLSQKYLWPSVIPMLRQSLFQRVKSLKGAGVYFCRLALRHYTFTAL